jgi:hypothetical protein
MQAAENFVCLSPVFDNVTNTADIDGVKVAVKAELEERVSQVTCS